MIDRKILIEKMLQFGIDWIGSSGFLDEGQVNHVLDIVEKESGLTPRAADVCPVCAGKRHIQTKSRGLVKCASCNGTGQRR